MMRTISLLLFFGMISSLYSQKTDLEKSVAALKIEIRQAENKERLKLLDSLSTLVQNKKEFKYDSIVRTTIDLAIEMDNPEIAAKNTSNLIFYLSNRVGRPNEAMILFNDFITSRKLPKDNEILANLYLNGADSHYYSGKIDESIEVYKISEEYALMAGDSITYGAAKEYRSDAYARLGFFTEASILLQEAEDIYLAIKDTTRLILTQNSRANLYSQIGFFKEAEEERNEVIKMAAHSKYYPALISALYNAAIDNYKTGNISGRIENLNKALNYTRESIEFVDLYEPRLLNRLLEAYSKADSLHKARVILNEIQKTPERNTTGVFKDMYLLGLANYYLANDDLNNALSKGTEFLENKLPTKNFEDILVGHELLFRVNEALGNSKEAFYHYKEFDKIQDSIRSVQKAQALSYYQTLYESEKRDATIRSQNAEIDLLDTKNKVQFQWMFIIALVLLGAGAFYYFNNRKNKQEAEIARNKRALAEMENDMLNKEIEYKKKDLVDFAFNISQNQKWAKVLAEKLEKMKAATGRVRAKKLDELEKEIKNKIWVDDSSYDFHNRVEMLSRAFYEKLTKRYPDLTKTEIRLCSLIRMNIENKEIAILQNIEPSSVKKSRYRLRKKLNLDHEEDLDNFLQSF